MIKFLKKSIKILCICLLINFILSFTFNSFIANNPIRDIFKIKNNAEQARDYAFKSPNPEIKMENGKIIYKYKNLIYSFNKDKTLAKISYKSYYGNNYYYYSSLLDYILRVIINPYVDDVFSAFSFISLYITLPFYSLFFLILLFIELFSSKFL